MPNLDVDINSFTSPWYLNRVLADFNSDVYLDEGTILDGYPVIHLKEYRQSTNRNSKSTGGLKPRAAHRAAIYEWYREKPTLPRFGDLPFGAKYPIIGAELREAVKLFRAKKADWRKRRPVKQLPRAIPPGWELVSLPSGKYELRVVPGSNRNRNVLYQQTPVLIQRLRPKKFRRQDPHKGMLAKVNDLYYFKQEATTDGWSVFTVMKEVGGVISPVDDPVPAGNARVGWLYSEGDPFNLPWESTWGFSSNPMPDHNAPVDPATLLTKYASDIDEINNVALSRHYQKLKNQKVDLATELSQAMLTVNMIADLSKRLVSVLLSLRKLDLVGAFLKLFPTSRKEAANDFLVWQYGIKPLISDINGAAEHLAEYLSKMQPVKSNGHAKRTVNTSVDSVVNGLQTNVTRSTTIRVKYGSSFGISDDVERQVSQLGFTNPAQVLWELVPYSFVVDWFLPIGNFMESLSALKGLNLIESYKTVFIEETETITSYQYWYFASPTAVLAERPLIYMGPNSIVSDFGYLAVDEVFSTVTRKTIYCKREVITLPDIPPIQFKNPISPTHMANATALFSQLIK